MKYIAATASSSDPDSSADPANIPPPPAWTDRLRRPGGRQARQALQHDRPPLSLPGAQADDHPGDGGEGGGGGGPGPHHQELASKAPA